MAVPCLNGSSEFCGVWMPRTAVALSLALTVACGGAAGSGTADTPESTHEHEAPHGGTLVELGDEFAHLELVRDAAAGTVTAYVLDGEAEQPIRIRQQTIGLLLTVPAETAEKPFELAAQASVLTGETAGDTSQFALTHEVFRQPVPLEGSLLPLEVRGQMFRDIRFTLPATASKAP
jgi:hypothetical protein